MAHKRSQRASSRDPGPFLALLHGVLLSAAYRNLSHTARSLLIDIGQQYNRYNNGKLTACAKYLKRFGWTSNDVVTRAKAELLASGLLIETRKGGFPNRAA